MNCVNHPEAPAVAYCRECGKALCETCRRQADGTIYCEEHAPAACVAAPPPPPAASTGAIALHGARTDAVYDARDRTAAARHRPTREHRRDSPFCWASFPAWAPSTTANM